MRSLVSQLLENQPVCTRAVRARIKLVASIFKTQRNQGVGIDKATCEALQKCFDILVEDGLENNPAGTVRTMLREILRSLLEIAVELLWLPPNAASESIQWAHPVWIMKLLEGRIAYFEAREFGQSSTEEYSRPEFVVVPIPESSPPFGPAESNEPAPPSESVQSGAFYSSDGRGLEDAFHQGEQVDLAPELVAPPIPESSQPFDPVEANDTPAGLENVSSGTFNSSEYREPENSFDHAKEAKRARAATVAKLIDELNHLKPQLFDDEAEYDSLKAQYKDYLTFRIAGGRPDLKQKVMSIRSSTRHIRLAQELAGAHHGRELSTIQDDWKDHKPDRFKRPVRGFTPLNPTSPL